MKRFVVPLFALALLGLTTPASAGGRWVTKEIFWLVQGGRAGTTLVSAHDTTSNVIAGGQTDTTGWFSLNDAIPYARGTYPVSPTSDTLTVAWIVFTPDSGGVTAPTVSSLTVKLDGGIRGTEGATVGGADYPAVAQVDSMVVTGLSTRGAVAVPIRAYGLAPEVAGANGFIYQKGYSVLGYSDLRARITAATGVMSAARAYIRYWTEK